MSIVKEYLIILIHGWIKIEFPFENFKEVARLSVNSTLNWAFFRNLPINKIAR